MIEYEPVSFYIERIREEFPPRDLYMYEVPYLHRMMCVYHTHSAAVVKGVLYYLPECRISEFVHALGCALFDTTFPEEAYKWLGWEWSIYKWLGKRAEEDFLASDYCIGPDESAVALKDMPAHEARAALDAIKADISIFDLWYRYLPGIPR